MRFFFASSTPLRMASGTSPALPRPTPTWPAPSPTTTTALKLKRRPPLTTLATRLIWTTRSSSASLFGSMRAIVAPSDQNSRPASRAASASDLIRPWYRNPARSKTTRSMPAALARSATSRPTTAASSVLVDLEPLSSFSTVEAAASVRAGRVVDDLRVDVVEAAEDRETRPPVRPRQVEADPVVALASCGAAAGDLRHRVSPSSVVITSCRRSCRPCRPCGGCARRRSARPCPCRARACASSGPWRRSGRPAPCRCRRPRGGSGSRPRS